MKNTKRWLILFFTFAFFFGSVAIGLSTGNIGADLPEADYFSSQAVTGDITFYVPETIYLTPVDGSMSTFQYYVDC
ncbi:MAG TPA: hypothetical protein P5127_04990, partial [Oscillospiraceae bacterium]|nr:hypothetical protein [Oscillospiraceae bacterium]